MIRSASAQWTGGLKGGKGTLLTLSGALSSVPYSFSMRFEESPGTNPEELIAAAHAGCFTMQLSALLEKAGYVADKLDTQAKVTFEKVGEAFTVTKSDLTLNAKVPRIDQAQFQAIAEEAKRICPISRLLNLKMTLDARLEK